jgi:hypothetical protein
VRYLESQDVQSHLVRFCRAHLSREASEEVLMAALVSLENIVLVGADDAAECGDMVNQYARNLKSVGGVRMLVRMLEHPDDEIAGKADSLLAGMCTSRHRETTANQITESLTRAMLRVCACDVSIGR